MLKPVVQLDRTGCGIASAAAIAGLSYSNAKAVADSIGIAVHDTTVWSDTALVRRLLEHVGVRTGGPAHPVSVLAGVARSGAAGDQVAQGAGPALLALGRLRPPARQSRRAGFEARASHESPYGLRTHETQVVHPGDTEARTHPTASRRIIERGHLTVACICSGFGPYRVALPSGAYAAVMAVELLANNF